MPKKVILVIGILLSVGVVLFSYNKSKNINFHSDYYVFYQAGQNYSSGSELYSPDENVRPFLYPPFAALVFQVLAVMPFNLSANIFCLFNFFVLLPFVFYLLLKTIKNFGFFNKAKTALIFSTICSAHFFWSNLSMLQVNFLVFAICATGIYFYSKNLMHLSALCFVMASFIKVFPVFFLIFVVLSNIRSRKVLLYTTIAVILCLVISIIPRGIEAGINDHLSYYNAFLKEFQEGRVITTNSNHTLKSLTLKALYPETRNVDVNASIYKTPMMIANTLLLILFTMTAVVSVYAVKRNNSKNYVIVFSLIFIFTHLISGITWTAHLVTTMFSYLPLFMVDPKNIKNLAQKIMHYAFLGLAFFLAIEGKDTTGEWLYNVLSFYDVFVIFPLILFI